MKADPLDRWLRYLTFGVSLVRVLRGDDPKEIVRDVERMNERATQLRDQIETAASSPSSGSGKGA